LSDARVSADASALELEGISLSFGALAVLDDINLCVGVGERVAVLGINGAGKTSLLNLINGDLKATKGAVRFFGEDITRKPPYERAHRGLRRTYQTSLLFGGLSVFDNLYIATRGVSQNRYSLLRARRKDTAMEAARRLLQNMRLEDIQDELVANISHGQQRQLEIGMALAGQPRFILFDEPAAGLSQSERSVLIDVLNNLPGDTGYMLIEHDLEVALRVVDRVAMIHNGRIFKEGTPQEFENDPDVQEIYLGKR